MVSFWVCSIANSKAYNLALKDIWVAKEFGNDINS